MMTGWNAMMAAAVFLPVFVAGVMGRRRGRSVRLAAIGLAPLVPATPITFQVIGATMLSGFRSCLSSGGKVRCHHPATPYATLFAA
jgi:hypothetical protein